MRKLGLFLIALAFLLPASFVSAASAHSCCHDADCPATQCATMGCLPDVPPAALGVAPRVVMLTIGRAPIPAAVVPALPLPLKEVWTPPD